MTAIREPAVAGLFYPDDPRQLRSMIARLLDDTEPSRDPAPKALVAPHAGFAFSGPVAATAFARLRPARHRIQRVILLGPDHHVGIRGLAASQATQFATPLGNVPVDLELLERVLELPQVTRREDAHLQEHSLETHLPFLQMALDDVAVLPLVVGVTPAEAVAEVLERVWGGVETLIAISSDLSHYHDYDTARALDTATSKAIEALDADAIDDIHACGRYPLRGLLVTARRRGLRAHTLDLRNSGDTAGPPDRVVGYGAYVFQ